MKYIFYVEEVLPGDIYKVKTVKVLRLQTPVVPIMANLYANFYYFFVPNRLAWEHWRNLMADKSAEASKYSADKRSESSLTSVVTYQQGIEKFWSRKERLDYYYPVLANIGEQPVLFHSQTAISPILGKSLFDIFLFNHFKKCAASTSVFDIP